MCTRVSSTSSPLGVYGQGGYIYVYLQIETQHRVRCRHVAHAEVVINALQHSFSLCEYYLVHMLLTIGIFISFVES